MICYGILDSVPDMEHSRELNRPWHKAVALHWLDERRLYETNEETNTPIRDGLSDRLGVPVKAGCRASDYPIITLAYT
jgi:hypothetical protein